MERFNGIRRIFRLREVRRDLDEELSFHFERTVEELIGRGRSRADAEAEARRRFGDEREYRRELEAIDRRAAAERRWLERLSRWRDDVRYAFRRMGRSPGLTAAVVLTFALGIGVNATMFGIVDRLLLEPPAHVADPGRLERIGINRLSPLTGERSTGDVMSVPDVEDFAAARSFSGVAAYADGGLTLGRGDAARPVNAKLVSGGFFPVLGVRPALGRLLGAADDRPGERVAVLGYDLWHAAFAGDPGVLGKTVDFGYGPYTIVGVAPRDFTGVGLSRVDLWLPLRSAGTQIRGEELLRSRGWFMVSAVARLAPGVTPEAAAAEATALHRAGRADEIAQKDYDASARAELSPLTGAGPGMKDESAVARWLAGVSLIVLLIACANVANLLLARAVRERRETGVRLALGVSRRRLLGQLLLESLMLALLGGAAALLVAHWGSAFVRAILLPDIAWGHAIVPGRVLLFVVVLALLAGVAAGVVPAIQASRPGVLDALRSGGRGYSSPASRTRAALTVFQAALSVVLLVGAGLFVRSLVRVESVDLGVRPEGMLLVRASFDRGTPAARKRAVFERAEARMAQLPRVAHVATVDATPFAMSWATSLKVPGLDSLPQLPGGGPYVTTVGHDYFATIGLPVVRGRGFSAQDGAGAPLVAVVSRTMARTLWPGRNALGQCLLVGKDASACTTVVGVVGDAHRFDIEEDPAMQYYLPEAQRSDTAGVPSALLVRARGDEASLIPALRRELLALDPGIRYADVGPFSDLVDPSYRSWKLGATLFSAFGLLALVVAGLGLYSVLAFGVAQRRHEIGIRSALGAPRERLVALVFGQGVRLVAVGVLLGLAASLIAAPRIASLLFDTSPRDPLTLGVVAAALLAVAALASALPAWRATRVDPNTALRAE